MLLGASAARAHAQEGPIALEGLLASLSYKTLDSKTLIKKVKERGVDFRLYAVDEQKIRKAGEYLPKAGLDKLVETVRSKYRVNPKLILSGEIEQVEVADHPGGGSEVFVRLTIKNVGDPIRAHKYILRIVHTTSTIFEFNGPARRLTGPSTLSLPGAAKALVIQPQESLMSKTSQAIGKSKVSGWLKFILPDPRLKPDYLRQLGTIYIVSFDDVYGYTSRAYYEMR